MNPTDSIEFLTLGIDIFDVENIFEKNAGHVQFVDRIVVQIVVRIVVQIVNQKGIRRK